MVAFNSKVTGWRDRLVDVSERALQSAWTWVQGLTCWGSTNTYAAIQMALADTRTQAIYLLSDGRPDQVRAVWHDFTLCLSNMSCLCL